MRCNKMGMAAPALLVSLFCGCAADTGSSAPYDPDDEGVAAEPRTQGVVGSVSEREVYNPPGYNPPGTGVANPPGYNPPGTSVGTCGAGYTLVNGVCTLGSNPPGYNPPGTGVANPPGYNPPGTSVTNPPGYNPPGTGVANPPGSNPPG